MFIRSLKSLFLLQAIIGVLLVVIGAATSVGIVTFHYPRSVENDPLLSPIKVATSANGRISLPDGRTIECLSGDSIDEAIAQSGFLIDIEVFDSDVLVYAKRRGWCGTPFAAPISIPLIEDKVPINRREIIATGRMASANDISKSE